MGVDNHREEEGGGGRGERKCAYEYAAQKIQIFSLFFPFFLFFLRSFSCIFLLSPGKLSAFKKRGKKGEDPRADFYCSFRILVHA